VTTTTNGFSDVGLEAKWRFCEEGGTSMASKAGVIFPSGDESAGLGTGNRHYPAAGHRAPVLSLSTAIHTFRSG